MSTSEFVGSGSRERLWVALRSADPVDELVRVVRDWKEADCTNEQAEGLLTAFRVDVVANGGVDEDDAVLDVLDFVVGSAAVHEALSVSAAEPAVAAGPGPRLRSEPGR